MCMWDQTLVEWHSQEWSLQLGSSPLFWNVEQRSSSFIWQISMGLIAPWTRCKRPLWSRRWRSQSMVYYDDLPTVFPNCLLVIVFGLTWLQMVLWHQLVGCLGGLSRMRSSHCNYSIGFLCAYQWCVALSSLQGENSFGNNWFLTFALYRYLLMHNNAQYLYLQ